MLTGLLMLWMAAGEVKGQAFTPENYTIDHTDLFADSVVVGADVWYDGKYWVALRAPNDPIFPATTKIVCFTGANPVEYTLSPQVTLFDSIWPNDIASGEPNYEFNLDMTRSMWPSHSNGQQPPGYEADVLVVRDKSFAYAVGGYTAMVSTTVESDGESYEIPPQASTGAWLFGMRTRFDIDTGNHEKEPGLLYPFPESADFRTFHPTSGFVESTCIDTSPVNPNNNPVTPDAAPMLAIGGMFYGDVQFEGTSCAGYVAGLSQTFNRFADSLDGYVVAMTPHAHTILGNPAPSGQPPITEGILQIGADNSADAVLGVSINPNTGSIVVCGYYSSPNVDFDPHLERVVLPENYAGARDIFVASYRWGCSSMTPQGGCVEGSAWALEWVWTFGTEFDDAAESVVSDLGGRVYFTGWLGEGICSGQVPCSEDPYGDLIVGCLVPVQFTLPPPPPPSQQQRVLAWKHTIGGSGDEKGMDVCVDYLGRPVVTGYFGDPQSSGSGYQVDFDPRPTWTHNLTSSGRTDAFTSRYHPTTGILQWAYGWGGAGFDAGYAVNIDQYNTSRWVVGGEVSGAGTADLYEQHIERVPELHTTLIVDDYLADAKPTLLSADLTNIGYSSYRSRTLCRTRCWCRPAIHTPTSVWML